MKYLILSLLMFAAGCDTPTRARFPTSGNGNSLTAPGGGTFEPAPVGTTTSGTTGGTTPPSPGFENCNLAKSNSTADLGGIGICKSTLDETTVRFVSSSTNTSSRTCLIPTYKDQAGNSTYLGDPQCTYTEAEKVYTGRLYKNRSGMAQYPLNGVMVMKEELLVEYFACMDSYLKYIQYYCPQAPNYAPCVQAATNYRNSVCNNFKMKYPNNYLDLYLR